MTKKLSVGGQAVIEGVMMKGPEKMAVAVRQANGEIAVDVKPVSSIRAVSYTHLTLPTNSLV